jgi:hypothetical protein
MDTKKRIIIRIPKPLKKRRIFDPPNLPNDVRYFIFTRLPLDNNILAYRFVCKQWLEFWGDVNKIIHYYMLNREQPFNTNELITAMLATLIMPTQKTVRLILDLCPKGHHFSLFGETQSKAWIWDAFPRFRVHGIFQEKSFIYRQNVSNHFFSNGIYYAFKVSGIEIIEMIGHLCNYLHQLYLDTNVKNIPKTDKYFIRFLESKLTDIISVNRDDINDIIDDCLDILLYMQMPFLDLQSIIERKFSFFMSGNQIFHRINDMVIKSLEISRSIEYLTPIWRYYFLFAHEKKLLFYKNLMFPQNSDYIRFVDDYFETLDFLDSNANATSKTHLLLKTIREPPDNTPSRYQIFLAPRWPIIKG